MSWQKTTDSGMLFMAQEFHNEVRLQFAINIPFDAQFMIDLRRDEARALGQMLLQAAAECRTNGGESEE